MQNTNEENAAKHNRIVGDCCLHQLEAQFFIVDLHGREETIGQHGLATVKLVREAVGNKVHIEFNSGSQGGSHGYFHVEPVHLSHDS